MGMDVRELNEDQLDELRWAMFYCDWESLDTPMEIMDELTGPDDITDEMIFQEYKDYLFVNDDFACTEGR